MGVKSSANFTRPSNTTPYAAGDLVANSATANLVAAMTLRWGFAGSLRRFELRTSNATITNGNFKIWLFNSDPSALPTNGDNGALAGLTLSTVIAVVPIDLDDSMSGQGGRGEAYYDQGLIETGAGTIYALLEAAGAYVPASAEVFTLTAELSP